jgi:predicted amidohydrolase
VTVLRIALAALPPADEYGRATQAAIDALARAAHLGARIVAFPECFVPGYRALGRDWVPPLDMTQLERAWSAIGDAARAHDVVVVLGTERLVDGAPRITALVLNADGTRAGFQDKVQLDPSEGAYYTPASERRLFRVDGVPFGVVICHEGWRYPETVRALARAGAQIVFHPHFGEAEATSFRPDLFADPRNTFHEGALRCRAAENTIWFASVNCATVGAPTTSVVVDPDGNVHALQPHGVPGVLVADVELTRATRLLASRHRPAIVGNAPTPEPVSVP